MKNPQVLVRSECPECEGFGISSEPNETDCRTCGGEGWRDQWLPLLHRTVICRIPKVGITGGEEVLVIELPKPKSPLQQLAETSIISKDTLDED